MKSVRRLIYIFIGVLLLTSMDNVYAEDIKLEAPPYWGSAGAYASSGSLGNGGSKCSEETTLCFSGSGLYMRLIRYRNGREETVGVPVLFNTSKFLREEYVVDEEAEEVPMNEQEHNDLHSGMNPYDFFEKYKVSKSGCHILYEYRYEFEIVTKYPTKLIQYELNNTKKVTENGLPSPASGQLPVFIKSKLIPKYLSSKEAVQSTFEHTFTFEEMQHLEDFYIIFDVARRVKGNKIETDVSPTVTSGDTGTNKKEETYEYSCSLTNEKIVSDSAPRDSYSNGVGKNYMLNYEHFDEIDDHTYTGVGTCMTQSYDFETETDEGVSECSSTSSFTCKESTKNDSYVSCKNTTYRYKCDKLKSTGKESKYVYRTKTTCEDACDGTCSGKYTKYNKTTYTCKRTDQYDSWVRGSCIKPSVDYVRNLYTKTFTAHSKIVLGRSRPTTTLIRGLFTPKDEQVAGSGATVESHTRHDILDKNNNPTGQYEWYIGPSLKTALVGWNGNNKYKMWDATQPASALTTSKVSEGYAVGMSIWWLPDLMGGCKDVCKNKSGDELLKCAENFCDNDVAYDERWSSQEIKKACILACGYEEVYEPNNCTNLSPNSEYMKALEIAKNNTPGSCDEEHCKWLEGDTVRVVDINSDSSIDQAWCYSAIRIYVYYSNCIPF